MKDYSARKIDVYVRRVYNLRESDLFKSHKVDKKRRDRILNDLFLKHTGYRLTSRGLEKKDGKDCFDAYTSFDGITSYRNLESDIAQTVKRSKNRLDKMKRASHLKSKQKFKHKQQEKIEKLDDKKYLAKWDADTKKRRDKLSDLKKKREQEQSKNYDR